MLRSVFLKTLRDQGHALLWWGIGLVALAVMMVLFYPSVGGNPAMEGYLEALPEELLALFGGESADFTSPEGFLNVELFSLIAPLLLLIFAIGFGSNAIAGEEERGTLELLLSNPLTRWRVAVEKSGAMVVATLMLGLVFWVGLAAASMAIGMEISLSNLAAACFSMALLGLTFGALALAVGCARGKRGLSMGVASAGAVAAYFLNGLAPVVEVLEPFRKLSPFYYYISAEPLKNGLDLGHAAVLAGVTAVLLVVGLVVFERRDLAV